MLPFGAAYDLGINCIVYLHSSDSNEDISKNKVSNIFIRLDIYILFASIHHYSNMPINVFTTVSRYCSKLHHSYSCILSFDIMFDYIGMAVALGLFFPLPY